MDRRPFRLRRVQIERSQMPPNNPRAEYKLTEEVAKLIEDELGRRDRKCETQIEITRHRMLSIKGILDRLVIKHSIVDRNSEEMGLLDEALTVIDNWLYS